MPSLTSSIKNFNKLKILVLGDLILDEYLDSDVSRISPEAPIPIAHVKNHRYVLGGAANVAHNLTSLTIKSEVIGLLGTDPMAGFFLELLQEAGIEHAGIIHKEDFRTIQKTRVVAMRQQLLRIDHELFEPYKHQITDIVIDYLKENIKKWNAIVISDYAKGFFNAKIAQQTIQLAKQAKIPIIVDTKPKNKTYYNGATVLVPNHKEAEAMSHEEITNEESLEKVGRHIQKDLNCDLIITRGADGMCIFEDKHEPEYVATQARQVYDVSGAGDTVAALIAAGLASKLSLKESARLANAGAGIVVGKFGTATLTQAELFEALKNE